MTYFLLVFDRTSRRLVADVEEFSDAKQAVRARFEREAANQLRSEDLEVVVLGAANREALENTHSRYFGSVREMTG